MSSSPPPNLDLLAEIPDPAARIATRPVPATPAAPTLGPSPTRQGRRLRAALALVGAALWILVIVLRAGPRPDLTSPAVMALVSGWVLLGAFGLGFVLRPRARGLPAGVGAVLAALVAIPAAYLIGSLSSGGPPVPTNWSTAGGCLCLSSALALGPLALGAVVLRRSFASAPALRGAAVGALAGLAGAIGVHMHCPTGFWQHIVFSHAPVIALGALLGAGLGWAGGRS